MLVCSHTLSCQTLAYTREMRYRRPRPRKFEFHVVLALACVCSPFFLCYISANNGHRPNIPLSATSKSPIVPAPPLTYYVPPHPQKGSPYHRYCLFLLPQPDATQPTKIPVIKDEVRLGFNLREFCGAHGYDVSAGGGAHMWREVWNETVSDIYRDTLSEYLLCFAHI